MLAVHAAIRKLGPDEQYKVGDDARSPHDFGLERDPSLF